MKQSVNPFDYAGHILQAMPKGILLTAKHDGKINTMTIGWGMVGIEWGKPVFIALVRESRYTKQLLEESGEFTVNIPYGDVDSKILSFCGTKSGRDVDKIEALGLTLEEPVSVSAPGIRELPLTLECKVLYQQQQDLSAIPENLLTRFYPHEDAHIAYYAEILNAYLITE